MNFYGQTDRDALSYARGQQIVFIIRLLDNGQPVMGKNLKWELRGIWSWRSSGPIV